MTLPNKLTLGRLAFTPVYFFIFILFIKNDFYPILGLCLIWAIFIISEISDVLDGHIARKHNMVSDVGKLLDPFADVMARVTYFLCFYMIGLMPVWALIIIIWREYSISFIRTLVAREGVAMAASVWGKAKAVMYFLSGVLAHIVITLNLLIGSYAYDVLVNKILYIFFTFAAASSLFSFLSYLRSYSKTETHKKFLSE